MVSVDDQGSKPQYVNVTIQGVTTSGTIDIGADITIIGGELLKKVSNAAKVKEARSDFPYLQKQFKFHDRMDLEIGSMTK